MCCGDDGLIIDVGLSVDEMRAVLAVSLTAMEV
jgi:hypothetical protein